MERLKFEHFTWPQNPERFQVEACMEPLYTVESDGSVTYRGLGPLCRTIRGSGIFQGSDAVKTFHALAVYMSAKVAGTLIHPEWGRFSCCLVELNMEQDWTPDTVAYSFVFRETDEKGVIPPLPEHKK